MSKVNFLVEIEVEGTAVKSSHRPLFQKDYETMRTWPSGGVAQTAHAFLMEALRREAYTMVLSYLSAHNEKRPTPEDVDRLVRQHVLAMLDNFSLLAAEEALANVSLQD